jgi:NAD(P)-dependent dehydrogenase (short-subunit alcohol dehydrogenase family)
MSVIVTGGTQGIGRKIVDVALESGASVTFCSRTETDVARVLNECCEQRIFGVTADIGDAKDVAGLFDVAVQRFGTVNAVIHAAAVMGPIGRLGDLDPNEWWDAVRIDLLGSFLITAEACRRMEEAGGRIVLFSGGGATTPFPRFSAYASSKVAVVRLVESTALEYAGTGIEINALAPGFVATRIHEATLSAGDAAGKEYLDRTVRDIGAGGVPAEVGATCACFLASPAARGISGRIVAAPWDDWERLPERVDQLTGNDLFTLRRIVPRDRGQNWQ